VHGFEGYLFFGTANVHCGDVGLQLVLGHVLSRRAVRAVLQNLAFLNQLELLMVSLFPLVLGDLLHQQSHILSSFAILFYLVYI